jgi:Tol biopolymer transport system component
LAARLSTIGILVLASLALAAPAHATFPGANGKIAFVRYGPPGDHDIWVANADGTDQVNLTNTPEYEWSPNWSPDGTKIAFSITPSSSYGPFGQIWTMNADGSDRTMIPTGTASWAPAWSPDGTRIAFARADGAPRRSFAVMNPDGSNVQRLAFAPLYNGAAGDVPIRLEWSPAGDKLVFSAWCFSEAGAYDGSYVGTIEANVGTAITPLTNTVGCSNGQFTSNWDDNPSWSPDAQRIAFDRVDNSNGTGPNGIDSINPDGTGLTSINTTEWSPSWSPDGTKIAIRAPGVMNADGSGVTTIPGGGAYDPAWQPIPINSYPRPRGATPLRLSLVPASKPCTSPNSTHGAPLSFGSCAPPQLASGQLTTGTPDTNGLPVRMDAYLLLKVMPGNPSTPADEADVSITAHLNDVFNKDFSDYTGSLPANLPVRITDKDNTPSPGGPGAATTEPFAFAFQIPCTPDPDSRTGSDCTISTTADTLVPGAIKEGVRAIWQLGQVRVFDGGADGDGSTTADNTPFMDQGLFVP